jgi:hypothetical protein
MRKMRPSTKQIFDRATFDAALDLIAAPKRYSELDDAGQRAVLFRMDEYVRDHAGHFEQYLRDRVNQIEQQIKKEIQGS